MAVLVWFYTGIATFVLYLCFYRWIFMRNFKGPKVWPVIGCTLELAWNRSRMYDWLTEYCNGFYPTWKIRLPGKDIVASVDPANVEYVFKGNFSNFQKGEPFKVMCHDTFGSGIFNTDGDLWKRQRKIASYEFASKVLRDYGCDNSKAHAVNLCRILDQASKDERPVEMMDLALRLSLESVCKLGFGVDMGSLDPSLPTLPFVKSFDSVTQRLADRYVDPLWKLKRFLRIGSEKVMAEQLKKVNNFTKELVLTRKAELEAAAHHETRVDLLSRFIGAIKEEPFTSDPIKDLQDAVVNFLLAGRDTSAAALVWTLYAISSHPRVDEKIVEELQQLEGEKDRDVSLERSFDDFARLLDYDTVNLKMQYLQAAILEALRLYPPLPFNVRMALKDDILPACGTIIRAGDDFLYSSYAQGRMEQLWGEDCLEYKPERWLRDGICRQESHFKYPVFHGGPRLCLGKDHSLLHLRITLAMLLRFFRFQKLPTCEMKYKVTVSLLTSDEGLKMMVQKR
ncbi:hypothetical protein R1sor_005303 [Riccia sorocarpa]|uniref:Cytochrome P450 n=1 Tax=Riccia sorocarpa TaxID=122646 RepID=A0ABD3HJE2_9MARC